MGYTHYWYRKPGAPVDAYGKLALDAMKILDAVRARGVKLGDWKGDPTDDDLVTEGAIRFNGLGDDSHETLAWEAETPAPESYQSNPDDGAFAFCKTAYKPYDVAVTAILIRAKVHYGDSIKVSSDGDFEGDWNDGTALCLALFGEAVNPMDPE